MPAIKNPAGSFYLDAEDFEIEHQQTPTGRLPVLTLKEASFEIPDLSDKYISTNLKGQPNGVAELDNSGRLLSSQLPSGVDKAEEHPTKSTFPEVGQSNIIYIDLSTNLEYRWSGTTYVQVPTGLALGNTAETAFRGDHGEKIYLSTINGKEVRNNPVLTASDVGAEPSGNLNQPAHTTMIVTASTHGQGFKADYSSSEIINHARTGVVILKYDDPATGRSQSYPFSFVNKDREAVFIRNFIVENEHKVKRYDIVIDYNEDVRVEEHSLSTIDLDIANAQVGYTVEVAKVGDDGRVTQWKLSPIVKMDDINLSNKTVMSSVEMVRRLAPIKTKKGDIVEMIPVEGYPFDIVAEINPVQAGENTPSITNVRDISGWDEILITLDNTIEQKEYRQAFGKTIYGGTYEPNRGKLTTTLMSKTFNGSENWEKIDRTVNGRTVFFRLTVPGLGANSNTMVQMCNIFKTAPISEPFTSDCVWAVGDEIYIGNQIVTQFNSDVNAFKAQLAKTNMQIVYELAKKQEEIVEQKKILAIEGRNVLQGSAGSITVKAPVPGLDEEDINNAIFNFLQTEVGKELIKNIVNGQL